MPRRFLQFSLRGLLVAMAVVAGAITVYRWPWVDERTETYFDSGFAHVDRGFGSCRLEFEAGSLPGVPGGWSAIWRVPSQELYEMAPEGNFRAQTTFCRGWNGRPQLHGPKTYMRSGWVYATKLYEHGELVRLTQFHQDGSVLRLETRRSGVAEGKYEFNVRTYRLAGNYRSGKREGIWEHNYRAHGEWITELQSYEAGLVHGEWTWQTATGKVLQSAALENGQLTHWNGRPWRDELHDWYDAQGIDQQSRELLNRPFEQVKLGGQSMNDSFATMSALEGAPPARVLMLNLRIGYPSADTRFAMRKAQGAPQEPAIAALLQSALLHSKMLAVRHGVIAVVPICETELSSPDRTGTAAVQFPVGSEQRAAWEAPVPLEIPLGFDSDWWFQKLFAATPIQIDGSEFYPQQDTGWPWIHTDDKEYSFMPDGRVPDPLSIDLSRPRLSFSSTCSRRQLLAIILTSRRWSCEQRGNVLVVHPYAAEVPGE